MALHHLKPTEVENLTQFEEGKPRHKALVKTDQFEAIRLSLVAGEDIPEHHVSGFATVHCLHGAVEMIFADRTVTMISGDWLYLDQKQRHAVRAVEDATVLLTIMLAKQAPRSEG